MRGGEDSREVKVGTTGLMSEVKRERNEDGKDSVKPPVAADLLKREEDTSQQSSKGASEGEAVRWER